MGNLDFNLSQEKHVNQPSHSSLHPKIPQEYMGGGKEKQKLNTWDFEDISAGQGESTTVSSVEKLPTACLWVQG
jgi:hypothetical protein